MLNLLASVHNCKMGNCNCFDNDDVINGDDVNKNDSTEPLLRPRSIQTNEIKQLQTNHNTINIFTEAKKKEKNVAKELSYEKMYT